MSFFKLPLPEKLEKRILQALCVGPLSDIKYRIANEFRDYVSQKMSVLYLKQCSKDEALDELCDYFGLERPSKE